MADTYTPEPTPLPPPRKPAEIDYSKLSDDELQKIASGNPQPDSFWNDLFIKYQQNAAFGTRPRLYGLGSGVGSVLGSLNKPEGSGLEDYAKSIKEIPKTFSEGYEEGRQEALGQEARIENERPGMSLAADAVGALATAPLFGAGKALPKGAGLLAKLTSGLWPAVKTGAALGTGQAIGHAETPKEAAKTIGGSAAASGLLSVAGNAIPMAGRGIGKGAAWLSSGLTGIPQKDIETWFLNSSGVKKLLALGGDSVPEAANEARKQTMQEISGVRQSLNKEIETTLSAPKYQGKMVDGTPIIAEMEDEYMKASRARGTFRPGDLDALLSEIENAKKLLTKDGKISIQDLNGLRQELQHSASGTYSTDKGVFIFPKYGENGGLAAQGAKRGGAVAREIIGQNAKELAETNSKLRSLHEIEDYINTNLIKPNTPESALLAAGSGSNQRNLETLEKIDQITGGRAAERAGLLSAGRSFQNAPLLPTDSTGKSAARMMAAGAAMGALGGYLGENWSDVGKGGAAGLLLSSPGVLRYGLMPAAKVLSFGPRAATSGAELIPQKYKNILLQKIIQEQQNKNERP